MMKRLKFAVTTILVSILGFIILSNPSKAINTYRYDFDFPSSIYYSMRYSPKHNVSSGTPYVYPDTSTVSTKYFLSPYREGWTQATNVQTISVRQKKYFTWNSGYGGSGQSYCLAGCPDADNGSWLAYHIEGDFGE